MASIKGKLFEYFVFRTLVHCGFRPVVPDGLLVYKGTPGLMVQGLGQPHNADVLLSPPIQTPFYYPTRLLVECKCYNDAIGLPQIRNALGLREDINNFEIVTEDILKNRKSNRSTKPKYHPMKRYVYQVAVASIDGFKSTAFPFALAHRIPLISFAHSALFANIRNAIDNLDLLAQRNESLGKEISSRISKAMVDPAYYVHLDTFSFNAWRCYIEEIDSIVRRITIGLLDDGTLLFLLRAMSEEATFYPVEEYDDGCSIHWSSADDSTWVLIDRGTVYYFELPEKIYKEWLRGESKQKKDALRIKQDHFSQIVLFDRSQDGSPQIRITQLSEEFMSQAELNIQ